jgi:hypothetical protein
MAKSASGEYPIKGGMPARLADLAQHFGFAAFVFNREL